MIHFLLGAGKIIFVNDEVFVEINLTMAINYFLGNKKKLSNLQFRFY